MSHTNACEKLFKRRKMELFEEAIVEESLGEKIKMVNELTRNIFFLLTIIFCALAFGQKPTVAIMVNDNKITDKSKKLSAGTYDQLHGEIEEYIDSKYAIFDRSDDVQKFLMKEHEYQRSGAVSDSTIKALGEQFGVQWLGIISVNWSIDKYHLQARLTDIVTRRSKTVNTTSSLKSNGEITSAAKEIANKLLGVADSKSMGGATPPSDGSRGSSAGFRDDKVGLDMIFVQGGTFTMGCTSEQGSDCWDDEKPAHNVTVSDYYIGKFPVTQRQWVAVMGSNPSHFKGDDLPVENVSWT
ncbi:MAG: formylglycine-generating enzyme family protein, partial [Fibromonadaceae bacterium]|nr:formylglycine-generating enzyme family protein [Fibromonadaceae bacterium]